MGEGRDCEAGYAEARAQEFVEGQVKFPACFCQAEHDVTGIAAFFADGSAGNFSFGDAGADVVFGSVGVEG